MDGSGDRKMTPGLKFSTKAENLKNLSSLVKNANVLPQFSFSVQDWKKEKSKLLREFSGVAWAKGAVIVRSSAATEDSLLGSNAGAFESVSNVSGAVQIETAVEKVIDSYGPSILSKDDQILIQPFLERVKLAGVAFSRDPSSGGPYILINYDDNSGRTDTITSGEAIDSKNLVVHRSMRVQPQKPFDKLCSLMFELEKIFAHGSLDIEFAFGEHWDLYLLQVRPLLAKPSVISFEAHTKILHDIESKLASISSAHPYLNGTGSIFGVMPDWNPVEIIGLRPKPLALTLYKELITDNIWAYQRDNYGYKNLRSFPLLISFFGLPYIDVRTSFNSFLPASIDSDLAEKLVNYYLNELRRNPANHDKVEFEIVFSCYTLDLEQRFERLRSSGFHENEIEEFTSSLKTLTNKIIHSDGFWIKDLEKIEVLDQRNKIIKGSQLDVVSKIFWLIEDCKRYGTLPFAGLARAGFIAVQLLRSLVNVGVLTENDVESFMRSLNSVSSRISKDFAGDDRNTFLEKYGHLRPGTYDIMSERYDENPNKYFDWENKAKGMSGTPEFALSLDQLKKTESLLKKHGLDHDVVGFFSFIKSAIEGREYAKFVFTKNLSDTLVLVEKLGSEYGLSKEDCSFLGIDAVKNLYSNACTIRETLFSSVETGKTNFDVTASVSLPPIIVDTEDVWCFQFPETQPNFVTQKRISGKVAKDVFDRDSIKDRIVLTASADPGFDWIFSQNIRGFITKYGGMNSHMAIRAAELGVPAVIGCGENLFSLWSSANAIEIDCLNKKVIVL